MTKLDKCTILFFFIAIILELVSSKRIAPKLPLVDNLASIEYFETWRVQHGKTYRSSEEHLHRYKTFLGNMKRAAILNARRLTSEHAVFGATQFADISRREFEQTILSKYKKSLKLEKKIYRTKFASSVLTPEEFDWTDTPGIVTSVKDQGAAGSCWAFAGNANLESLYGIKHGKQCPDLSEEFLNDCNGYSNPWLGWVACGPLGATMPAYYVWIMQQGGVMTANDYPYCIGDGHCSPCAPPGYDELMCGQPWPVDPCKQEDSCSAKYNRSGFVPGLALSDFGFFTTDEELLKDGLVEVSPLVAGIDATDLQLYEGGILVPDQCSPQGLNHAILLVGYGTTEGNETKFWRGKNSWGTSWGEDGYFRIVRGKGACGINSDVTSGFLK